MRRVGDVRGEARGQVATDSLDDHPKEDMVLVSAKAFAK
jgi:hypothetical protein